MTGFYLLGAIVLCAAYGAVSLAVSGLVQLVWRFARRPIEALPARRRAARLLTLRLAPAAVAVLATLSVSLPSFLEFEPRDTEEVAGPLLAGFAALGAGLAGLGTARLVAARRRTRRVVRTWSIAARPARLEGVSIPAFRIDTPLPVVALTGSRRPVLFVAGCVLDRCEMRLLAAMTAHEAGHRRSADNLKRLLLSACVDPLGFSPAGRAIAAAWESAAEEAADDAAVAAGTSPADLAEALVFVARLSPHDGWPVVPAAAFYAGGTLERRVRRLVEDPVSHRDVARPLGRRRRRIAAALLVAAAWLLAAEALHRPMYRLVESVVHHPDHQLRGLVVDRPRA